MDSVFSHNHAFLCDVALNDVIPMEISSFHYFRATSIYGSTGTLSTECFVTPIQYFPQDGVVAWYIARLNVKAKLSLPTQRKPTAQKFSKQVVTESIL